MGRGGPGGAVVKLENPECGRKDFLIGSGFRGISLSTGVGNKCDLR
jgi:hypothetical protein